MLKNFFIILFISSFIFISCNSRKSESINITNVKEKQSFTLKANPNHKHVWSVYFNITGEINGKAKIYSGYDTVKTFYSFDVPKGKVNTEKFSDWYANELILTFDPINCTEGNLKIDYDFGSD